VGGIDRDRRKLAVTLTVEPRFLEWGDPVDLTIVVDSKIESPGAARDAS
jgi:hypothetical protein